MPTAAANVLSKIEKQLSRKELSAILELQGDPKFEGVILRLNDDGFKKFTLSHICRVTKTSYFDIASAILGNAKADGLVRMAQQLPQVMEDIAIDALSRDVTCPLCQGDGSFSRRDEDDKPLLKECTECSGTGKIRKAGDPAARKSVLESAGLTGKATPAIAIQNNSLTLGGGDLEDTLKLLTGGKPQAQLVQAEILSIEEDQR